MPISTALELRLLKMVQQSFARSDMSDDVEMKQLLKDIGKNLKENDKRHLEIMNAQQRSLMKRNT